MNPDNLRHWFALTQQFQQEQFWKQALNPDVLAKEGRKNFENNLLKTRDTFPLCDLYQKEHLLFLEIELPGLTTEDIKVSFEQGKVIIKGHYHTLKTGSNYFLKERMSKAFIKEIAMPFPIIESLIRHTFSNGLFTLILPIQEDDEEEIQIEIEKEINN
ncbi:Hsp20/alpha crystallin family protein [Niallia endozanthoxylica]|uniref:Hsp20/alpha crystallin family protein n=1 Tax=Niallia endozanthoxylica TaxID=2036016 RepID=A0A5J5HMV3_9BACI|nr:Hsp20/alpha crystallin family protein [Niallia endozanthoxylica]KAA9021726.1 Hsp20/alpha crystallin family protein [Niallia endozanthoxylica]